jgi:hypothetical protein
VINPIRLRTRCIELRSSIKTQTLCSSARRIRIPSRLKSTALARKNTANLKEVKRRAGKAISTGAKIRTRKDYGRKRLKLQGKINEPLFVPINFSQVKTRLYLSDLVANPVCDD